MTVFIPIFCVLSLLLMWTTSCVSEFVTVELRNATSDLEALQTRISQLSSQYETVEGVCALWVGERKEGISVPSPLSSDCPKENSSKNKVETLILSNGTHMPVYYDHDTDGEAGLYVFQRRQDGSVDFYRGWSDYRNGFGDVHGEFWLGLDVLHMVTSRQTYELRVDLMLWDGTKGYATYSNFYVTGSTDNFRFYFDEWTAGNIGDSLVDHQGKDFSTKDRDHDQDDYRQCAQRFHGAWWYHSCHDSNLNGEYKHSPNAPDQDGLNWASWAGWEYSMKFTEMKIRPRTTSLCTDRGQGLA